MRKCILLSLILLLTFNGFANTIIQPFRQFNVWITVNAKLAPGDDFIIQMLGLNPTPTDFCIKVHLKSNFIQGTATAFIQGLNGAEISVPHNITWAPDNKTHFITRNLDIENANLKTETPSISILNNNKNPKGITVVDFLIEPFDRSECQ